MTSHDKTDDGPLSLAEIIDIMSCRPYADAASLYLECGLGVPIPIPPGQKYPPPNDCTGYDDDATDEDVRNWMNTEVFSPGVDVSWAAGA